MLEVERIDVQYGRAHALFEVSLKVAAGEVVLLLGRNGAGKSTLLKTIAGLVRPARGRVVFAGRRIDQMPSYRIARLGIGYVPEERRVFHDLTVAENLEVGRRAAGDPARRWTVERVCELFPSLAAMQRRRGGEMSGGEQQMLAIARTLMGNPRFILLDEPAEGLAPVIVEQLAAAITELRREGLSMLVSEQNMQLAQGIGDRAVVLESGRLRYTGPLADFLSDFNAREAYLGLE